MIYNLSPEHHILSLTMLESIVDLIMLLGNLAQRYIGQVGGLSRLT
jgi:hypothetical protein